MVRIRPGGLVLAVLTAAAVLQIPTGAPAFAEEAPAAGAPGVSAPGADLPSAPDWKVEGTELPGSSHESGTFGQQQAQNGPSATDGGQPASNGGQGTNGSGNSGGGNSGGGNSNAANNSAGPSLAPRVPGCFIDAAGTIPCRSGGAARAPAAPEPVVDVMTVVGRALTAMSLDSPPMCFAPNIDITKAVGLVGMYAWAWFCVTDIRESTVGPVHRTASAGGITVTATAVNTGVLINWGDGSAPTFCAGALLPFTPYVDAVNAAGPPSGLPSPSCGHRMEKASTTEDGGVFKVSATSTWVVNWSAITPTGALAGVIPAPLTSRYSMRVGEVQVLNAPAPR